MTRIHTSAQEAVLAQYRIERRLGLDPFAAARMTRGTFADDIAGLAVHGVTPSREQADRYRVADQWYMTLLARTAQPWTQVVRTLRDANRLVSA